MKIVHICMSQYSDGWSYQENMLAKYHLINGHSVTMITSEYHYNNGTLEKDNKKKFIDCNGVQIIRLPIKGRGIFGKIPVYENFYQTLYNENPEIIFSHGCQYKDILQVKKYVKNNNCLLYVDNHADFSNSARSFLSKNILHRMIWRFCAQQIEPYTQKFYGVLPARVDFLIHEYKLPAQKTELLVMGADDEMVKKASKPEIRESIRKKYKIKASDFLIITGGKIDLAKRQTIQLMKAVAETNRENVKLLVFGSVVPELQEQVNKYSDGEKVQFIGWVQAEDSYEYFASADLVVFPGRHSVFWEQVAGQGIPMICKRWAGTEHVDCGGNVVFLDDDTERGITDSILAVMKNYIKMKDTAVNTAMNIFSYKRIAERSICLQENNK